MASFVPSIPPTSAKTTAATTKTTTTTTTLLPITHPTPHPCILPKPLSSYATPSPGGLPIPPTTVIWFRTDLRLHDHPPLASACSQNHSIACLLLLPPQPSKFWYDAALDLRNALRARGAELYIRPSGMQNVVRFADAVGATMVYYHRGVTKEERLEEKTLGKRGRGFWNGLYDPDKLPVDIKHVPDDCDEYGRLIQNMTIEQPLAVPESIAGVSRCGLECGVIAMGAGVGGEKRALERVRDYCRGGWVDVNRSSARVIDIKFGRLGEYLKWGCVSERMIWKEVNKLGECIRTYCTHLELILRDFVRIMTLKHGVHPL